METNQVANDLNKEKRIAKAKKIKLVKVENNF